MVRPLALQCLLLGLVVLAGLAVLPRLSTRVYANALFHSECSSDPWGRPWVVRAAEQHGDHWHTGVIFSTGPDGHDDRFFTPDWGCSASDRPLRLRVDDIFIVRPDDFRLLGAMIVVGVARVAAACGLALGFLSFPRRARRSWLVAAVWVFLLGVLVTRGVLLLVEFRHVQDFLQLISPAVLPIHVVVVATCLGALSIVVAGAVVSARTTPRRVRPTATASVASAAP